MSATRDADVIVVGAGPAGSTAAAYLATAGVDVLLLEKAAFPREKVCGDGLTPRAVKELVRLGIDTTTPGWLPNEGLRVYGGGYTLELPWPELASYPNFGLTRARKDFDEILVRHAEKVGARLQESTTVTGLVRDERTQRVTGVTAKPTGQRDAEPVTYRARLVLAADGNSTRLGLAAGRPRLDNRPLGVAYRRYYTSPRSNDTYLEGWLELWDGKPGASRLLPGYGWVFPMGDGTCNVGLGILNSSPAFRHTDYPDLLRRWTAAMPPEWGYVEDNAHGPARGAALPMGFNRKPVYGDGLLLLGDAAGVVNPFNGEGIAYAMESAAIAADVVAQALGRRTDAGTEKALQAYPQALRSAFGGYFTLGNTFVKLIGHPSVMKLCTQRGLKHPSLMRLVLKLMSGLTDARGGDAHDRLINALTKVAPSA